MDDSQKMNAIPPDPLVSTGVVMFKFSTVYCNFTKIYINFSKKGAHHGNYDEYN